MWRHCACIPRSVPPQPSYGSAMGALWGRLQLGVLEADRRPYHEGQPLRAAARRVRHGARYEWLDRVDPRVEHAHLCVHVRVHTHVHPRTCTRACACAARPRAERRLCLLLLPASCLPPAAPRSSVLLATCYLLLATCYLLLAACYLLLTTFLACQAFLGGAQRHRPRPHAIAHAP